MRLEEIATELQNIIELYSPLLLQVSEEQSKIPVAEGKWSRKQILGHLIDSATNNHHRFIRAQLRNHIELPGYTQNDWIRLNAYEKKSWSDVVPFWKVYNEHLVLILSQIPDEVLHNTISLDGKPAMTLQFVAEDYVRHLKHHLEQMGLKYLPKSSG